MFLKLLLFFEHFENFLLFVLLKNQDILITCKFKENLRRNLMSDQAIAVNDVLSEAINSNSPQDSTELSLEALVLLINSERLKNLESKIATEFLELKKRQDEVSFLHKLIKMINTATTKDELDCTNNQELKDMLAKAKEYGVDLKEDKFKYNKEERERLIENIRITSDDNNVLNDMQLQTITRLTTERYESYQLARSIMRPLHEDKVNKARAISGR